MPRTANIIFLESTVLLAFNYISPVLFILSALIWFWPSAKRKFFDALKGAIIQVIPVGETEKVNEENDDETIEKSIEEPSPEDCYSSVGTDLDYEDLWINKIISRFWTTCFLPHISKEFVEDIRDKFYEGLESKHPKFASFMREIDIEEVTLGGCPVKVTNMSSVGSNHLIALKIGIDYPGNGNFSIQWRHPNFHASVRNLEVSLPLKVILGPLTRDFTILRAISVSFYESPTIRLDGGGLLYIPVELTLCLIKKVIMPLLEAFIVDPKCLQIRLPSKQFHYPVMSTPRGILKVILVEGKDLSEADGVLYCSRRSSDPYCIIRLGRNWSKSNRISRNINPIWNFVTEFAMLQEDFTKELIFELFDYNVVTDTGAMGLASIDLSNIDPEEESVTESWLNVSSATTKGYIRVMTQFVPCHEYLETAICKKGIMIMLIKTVESNQRIEPIIGVQINGKNLLTTARGNYGTHHEFVEQIVLLVDDFEEDLFRICLYDAANEYFNPKKLVKKTISVVHKSLNKESLVHKQGNIEDMDFYMIGDYICPVKKYLEMKTSKLTFFPKAEIEASVEVSAKVYQLYSPQCALENDLSLLDS